LILITSHGALRYIGKVCPSFHLYVVAFNQNCYDYLKKVNFPGITPISLADFEDEELLKIKPTRTAAEYCWTCTPSVIMYCLKQFSLSSCTYIDADMIFYHNPEVLLNEMGRSSILISEHRYTKEYDQADESGKYCVQFMCFKNNEEGMEALTWWRERCIEWCYARAEEGKFGDQKYLDDWTSRFKGVHVLEHPGGGVAPWNVQQFDIIIRKEDNTIHLVEKMSGKMYPLVFFHYHALKFFSDSCVTFSGTMYELSNSVKSLLYIPYVEALLEVQKKVESQGFAFNVNGTRNASPSKFQVFVDFVKERAVLFKFGKISLGKLIKSDFSKHYHFYKLDYLKGKVYGATDRS
jgi:hypothetical protein